MLSRLFKDFQGDVMAIPGRFIALIFVILLFFVPLFTQQPYILRMLILTNMFVIFAVSWDFISGYTGQMNFGHALFFGVAAYTTAFLNRGAPLGPHWPIWATIPIGALAATVAGVVMCLPALRLRGPYLALVTLAFPLILTGVIFANTQFTGGELGISQIDRISDSKTTDYYISVLVMLFSVFIMWKLTDTRSGLVRTGLILHAIREDEIAARASGINTIRYKLFAFIVGGFFAGIAGALYAHLMRIAGPSTLDITLSFQAIIWTVFGGIVSIYGAVVGVYILYPMMESLRAISEYRMLIFAGIVILILLFMPEGIAVWIRDKMERECPRCKLTNGWWRRTCRACSASLY
ncbi:MAG: branched-chain amino acid ABC transporter permease [Dehalococcoidia bacterium]|nr:branched-chain amino acid ABC transporter permease [Dehalococcoidia bacterium]